jgi:2-haloacid dehalogenase
MDEPQARVLFLDADGTVFDWHASVRTVVHAMGAERGVGIEAPKLVNAWRGRMAEILGDVRSGARRWLGAEAVQRLALDDIAETYPALGLTEADKTRLLAAWRALKPWPDAAKAVPRLRAGYTVVALTALSWAGTVASSKAAGIDWDGILACDVLGFYTPDPRAYRAALRVAGVAPGEAMLVSAHVEDDLRPARAVGIAGAYVARPLEYGEEAEPVPGPQPDMAINAKDLTDLADRLLTEDWHRPATPP